MIILHLHQESQKKERKLACSTSYYSQVKCKNWERTGIYHVGDLLRLEAAIIERSMKCSLQTSKNLNCLGKLMHLNWPSKEKLNNLTTCMRWGKLPCFCFLITSYRFLCSATHRNLALWMPLIDWQMALLSKSTRRISVLFSSLYVDINWYLSASERLRLYVSWCVLSFHSWDRDTSLSMSSLQSVLWKVIDLSPLSNYHHIIMGLWTDINSCNGDNNTNLPEETLTWITL